MEVALALIVPVRKKIMRLDLDLIESNDNLVHWLVVDAIRVPDIAEQAYKYEPLPELFLLFNNTSFEHLMDISPVVFQFTGAKAIVEQMHTDFAVRSSSVIFSCDNTISLDVIKQHLHDLITILINGDLIFFRYYSSAFWEKVALSLNAQDIDNILGPFEKLSWIDSKKECQSIMRTDMPSESASTAPFNFTSPIFVAQV